MGEHAFDKADGKGKEYYKDGGRYEGTRFVLSLFLYLPLLMLASWHDARRCSRHLPPPAGSFKKGEKHGQGVFYYPDDSRYDGEFRKNKRDGEGTYYYSNGACLPAFSVVGCAGVAWVL